MIKSHSGGLDNTRGALYLHTTLADSLRSYFGATAKKKPADLDESMNAVLTCSIGVKNLAQVVESAFPDEASSAKAYTSATRQGSPTYIRPVPSLPWFTLWEL